jgi:methylmalonyl-CoA/ethylmalonyl-CoA epimerase
MPLVSPLFLHHVGFVVADVRAGMEAFVVSLDATWNGAIYDDPHQKVKVAFLSTRLGDAQIELVQPDGPDSPVLRFLTEKGGGMHHLCYEVDNLEHQMAAMKASGAMIMRRPKPAAAFEGRRIAWMLTREKLLVELLEKKPAEPPSGFS